MDALDFRFIDLVVKLSLAVDNSSSQSITA